MDRSDFQKLYTYSDNCWRQLGDVLASADDAWNKPFETTSKWNTIRLLAAHSIAAEERMISFRLLNIDLPLTYDQRAGDDWDSVYRDHKTVRAQTYAYLESLTDNEITDREIVIPATVFPIGITRADALFHIFNHENYHRGEIISALQRLGFDPPNFDYILLKDKDM